MGRARRWSCRRPGAPIGARRIRTCPYRVGCGAESVAWPVIRTAADRKCVPPARSLRSAELSNVQPHFPAPGLLVEYSTDPVDCVGGHGTSGRAHGSTPDCRLPGGQPGRRRDSAHGRRFLCRGRDDRVRELDSADREIGPVSCWTTIRRTVGSRRCGLPVRVAAAEFGRDGVRRGFQGGSAFGYLGHREVGLHIDGQQ